MVPSSNQPHWGLLEHCNEGTDEIPFHTYQTARRGSMLASRAGKDTEQWELSVAAGGNGYSLESNLATHGEAELCRQIPL